MQPAYLFRRLASVSVLLLFSLTQSWAQPVVLPALDGKVLNRFRLFAEEADFNRLVEAQRGKSIQDAYRALMRSS
jgi:hypothetical protein